MNVLQIWDSAQVSDHIGSALANESSNADLAQRLLSGKTEIIEYSTEHELFRSGDHKTGKIAVFHKGPNS
jgi:hypothetical protein